MSIIRQNFNAVGQESSSGDPLLFENVTKMSKSFIYVGNQPREKLCFNLVFVSIFSLSFTVYIFWFLFRFFLGFCLSLFIIYVFKGIK